MATHARVALAGIASPAAEKRWPDARVLALVAVLLLVGATGCGEEAADEAAVDLPTSNAGESATSMAGQLIGVLAGDPNFGCVWLDTEERGPVTIMWPRGYRAEFDPLRLFDANSDEVAREGQRLAVAGGLIDYAPDEACGPADTVWLGSRPDVVD